MRTDPNIIKELRQKHQEVIRFEQGKSMANRIGALNFFECSAKTRMGLNEIFEAAAKAALNAKKVKIGGKNPKCTYL